MLLPTLYVVSISAANLSVAEFGPSVSIINAFFLIGLDLSLRDKLHDEWRGKNLKWKMAMLIFSAGFISHIINPSSGQIAIASMIAFISSNLVDSFSYAKFSNKPYLIRSNSSNVFGAVVDSIIFSAIAFGSLNPTIVTGQIFAKVFGGCVWSVLINKFGKS